MVFFREKNERSSRERFILFIWNRLSNAQTCFRFNRNLLLVETLRCHRMFVLRAVGKYCKKLYMLLTQSFGRKSFSPAVVVSKFAFASNLMQMIVGGEFESEQSKENSTTEEVWSNWRKFNCCKLRSRLEKLLN
jgi:hypothetical protein